MGEFRFSPPASLQTVMGFTKAAFLRLLSIQGQRPMLRFAPDGSFQLSIFEDLHYGEAENLWWGPQQDVNSTRVMNTVLDQETQQLVVLNGDLITGENTFKQNSTDYVNKIVEPLLQRDLPWASTYGNHDSNFNLSRDAIIQREHTWPNGLTQQMVHTPTSGVSNYYIPVYPANSWSSTPELILWFFDSRGGNKYQTTNQNGTSVAIADWVDETVVAWFSATAAALQRRYRRAIPSLAFTHIPVQAMRAFQAMRGVDPHREPGINDDDPLAQQGQVGDDGAYFGQDVPFMRALLATPGLLAVFTGHDHGDHWCFRWEGRLSGPAAAAATVASPAASPDRNNLTGNGLNLCFGRHSGYGGYGTWARGSRQVRVTRDGLRAGRGVVDTWVRLETGEVTGRVSLNATYGRDWYPAVPEIYT